MNKAYVYILLLPFLSCMSMNKELKSPPGYDLNKPERFTIPEALDEISGMCFYEGKKDTLYAEQDEEGKMYYLRLGEKKAQHVKFGKGGDYEDIAILNGRVFVLRSDGTLFSFFFSDIHQEELPDVKEWTGVLPEGEFEGLCVDTKTNQLYVLCKHCKDDETTKAITAYILQLHPDGSLVKSGSASISVNSGFVKETQHEAIIMIGCVKNDIVHSDAAE